MNTLGYLILIAVLLALATLMLYARFSSRSREKSSHHALGDLLASVAPPAPLAFVVPDAAAEAAETGSLGEGGTPFDGEAPAAAAATTAPEAGEPGGAEDVPEPPSERLETPEAAEAAPPAVREAPATLRAEPVRPSGEPASADSAFIDELQEAAAGLAKLMRSSPLSERGTPVVFAPVEGVEGMPEDLAEGGSDSAGGGQAEGLGLVRDACGPEGSLAPRDGALAEEIPAGEAADGPASDAEAPEECGGSGLLVLLGEQVFEELLRIDSGLDSLEEMVAGIESSLSVWAGAPLGSAEDEAEDGGGEVYVGAAA